VPASADALSLTSVGKGDWVSITTGTTSQTGWAGEINWLLTTPSFTESLYTYCVDLFDPALYTQNPITVKTTNDLTSSTSPNSTPGAGGRVAWLFNTFADGIHGLANNQVAFDEAAGLQIAIWETMYNSSAFTVAANADATSWAGKYLGALGTHTSVAMYLDAPTGRGQDQIAHLPEPSSVLLVSLALPLIFAYRRRRTSA
jgi:hypothetical protein